MEGKTSFSELEKEFLHVMRNGINNSEDKIDLENHFSNTMKIFLNRIVQHEHIPVEVDEADIIFSPRARNHFIISGKLTRTEPFKNLWDSSDLPHVIERFATTAHKKYLHLDKQKERVRFKIR